MHVITATELIWIIICAIALACFWRIVLIIFLGAILGTALLGLVTAASYFGH